MKIAIYYENRLGRNDGGPLYWCNAMKELGHDVTHFSSASEPHKEFGGFDLHVWIDWGEDALSGVLPYAPMSMKNLHPSIYVSSDTHLGYDYRLNKAKEFDHVFVNQKDAVEMFAKDGVKAEWLPHAVEPKAYPNTPVSMKKYDIGFVGYVSFEKRADMLDELLREFPNFFFGQKLFEDCAEIYRKSRIVFNTAATDDLNMRVFEATATGSFLLTENIPTIHELYEDGVDLVTFDSIPDAIEKARYYIEHEDEREQIAQAGMLRTLKYHTYKNRIEKALEMVFEEEEAHV